MKHRKRWFMDCSLTRNASDASCVKWWNITPAPPCCLVSHGWTPECRFHTLDLGCHHSCNNRGIYNFWTYFWDKPKLSNGINSFNWVNLTEEQRGEFHETVSHKCHRSFKIDVDERVSKLRPFWANTRLSTNWKIDQKNKITLIIPELPSRSLHASNWNDLKYWQWPLAASSVVWRQWHRTLKMGEVRCGRSRERSPSVKGWRSP